MTITTLRAVLCGVTHTLDGTFLDVDDPMLVRKFLKIVRDLPDEADCEHEGEHHRIETIEVSLLPWDHIDIMAFALHLIRATSVEGWYLQRANMYYFNRVNGQWEHKEQLREYPHWFAFPSVEMAVEEAKRAINKMRVNGFYWHTLEPAKSQYQEFADSLANLIHQRGG